MPRYLYLCLFIFYFSAGLPKLQSLVSIMIMCCTGQSMVQGITRSCCSAEWTAPKAAVRRSTFFILSPTSSAAFLLASTPSVLLTLSSALVLASASALTWPSSCSSLSSITLSRSLSLSASASSACSSSPDLRL